MRKDEFLKQLEYLLQDVPDQEKAEAIQYYRDYIEEAGPENEEKAVEVFGSPERVAAIIRADVMGNLEEGGSFTENGYEDERFRDPNYQVVKRFDLPEEKETAHSGGAKDAEYRETYKNDYHNDYHSHESSGYNHVKRERWTSKPLKWALWAVLLIMASPFILGAAGVACGLLVGIVSLLAGGLITVIGLTVTAFILAVVAAAFGVVFLAGSQLEGLLLIGLAIAGFGCGIIGLVIIVALVGTFLPFLWGCLVKLVQMVTGRGKEKKQHE